MSLRQRKPTAPADASEKSSEANAASPAAARAKTDMEIAQEKYKKFFTRSFWGSIMIAFFAVILYTDHLMVGCFRFLAHSHIYRCLYLL